MLLLPLIVSVYIPYSSTSQPTIPKLSLSDLPSYLPSPRLLVLALSDPDSKSGSIEPLFIATTTHFHSKCEFAIFDQPSSRNLSREDDIPLSSLILYTHGRLAGSWQVSSDSGALLFLLDDLLSPLPDPIDKSASLPGVLGNSNFAILATPNLTRRANSLRITASTQMGFIQVIPVTDRVLSELDIDPPGLALFREEDQAVVAIGRDVDSLYDASFPVFRSLALSDLQESQNLVFALVCDELTDEESNFLYEIGSRFPNITVGWAGADLRPYVEHAAHETLPEIGVAAIRWEEGSHFDLSEEFTPSVLAEFDVDAWVEAAVQALTRIEKGELSREFFSEEESPTDGDSPVRRLVGVTYSKFVLDQNFDAVVLFKRINCPHCETFLPVFEGLAADFQAAGIEGIRFGMIDVSKNSAELPFPYMPGVPHVYLFPANNKTGGDSLRGTRDRDGLVRFLKKWATIDIPFEAPILDKKQVALEFLQVIARVKTMPEEEKQKAMEYLMELKALSEVKGSEGEEKDDL